MNRSSARRSLNVFFAGEDGAIWHLSPIFGEWRRVWANTGRLHAELATEDGLDTYANAAWVQSAQRRGLRLDEDQSYHFVPSPALGGGFDAANIHVASTRVVLSLAGQLHRQLRGVSDPSE